MELFASWRAATGNRTTPLSWPLVQRFLADVPLGPRRLRQLRDHLALPRMQALPVMQAQNEQVRTAESWDEAIRACPLQAPTASASLGGLWGRRDAFVLALGAAGVTRREVCSLRPGDIALAGPGVVAAGELVMARSPERATCRACIVVRWVQMCRFLPPAGGRHAAMTFLATKHPSQEHECAAAHLLGQQWREVYALIPAIDQHGWASHTTVTPRTITAIWNRRRPVLPPEQTRPEPEGRLDRAQVVAEIDALLDRLEAGLDDVGELMGR